MRRPRRSRARFSEPIGCHGRDVGDLGTHQIDRLGAVGHAGAAVGHRLEFVMAQFPAMGIEGVRPGKAEFGAVIHRAHAVAGLDDRAFALADMGMHHDAPVSRQPDRFDEGLAVAIDRLAGATTTWRMLKRERS